MGGIGPRALPLLAGVLPVRPDRLPRETLAGLTLAALAVPEVLGYARIAGMPVSSGLYTMLAPAVVFAVLGASRHLVVGADSATAAILAAGLAGMAAPASSRYVALAGLTAALVALLLVVARLARIGFLAQFLSRTVLVGFLTGVGVQVAVGQLADMLAIRAGGSTPVRLWQVVTSLPRIQPLTAAVSVSVVVVVLVLRRVSRAVPGALLAVVGAVAAERLLGLRARGVEVLGPVPGGLPRLGLPEVTPAEVGALLPALLPVAGSMVVVILAQSAATARAYAARYDERPDIDTDLVGLAGANLAAALTTGFVVNGSPTKTQMVDGAGGRSQLAQLVAAAAALAVVVALTGPLAGVPLAALAAVVFLIGLELVDLAGLRRIWLVRRAEFAVAALTALAVVLFGVQTGIAVAVVASIVDHLRHSYAPHNAVMVKSPAGHWHAGPVSAGARTRPGLVIYRFGTSLYFANAARLAEDVATVTGAGPTPRWFCFDFTAIGDVDYSAGAVLGQVHRQLVDAGVRVLFCGVIDPVREQLDRYGLGVAPAEFRETSGEVFEEYRNQPVEKSDGGG